MRAFSIHLSIAVFFFPSLLRSYEPANPSSGSTNEDAVDCDAARALSDLSLDLRKWIEDICLKESSTGSDLKGSDNTVKYGNTDIFEEIIKRLSAKGGWQLAAATRLIPQFYFDASASRNQSALNDETDILKGLNTLEEKLFIQCDIAKKDIISSLLSALKLRQTLNLPEMWGLPTNSESSKTDLASCRLLDDPSVAALLKKMASYYAVSIVTKTKDDKPTVYSGFPLRIMPISAKPIPVENQYLHLSVIRRGEPYFITVPGGGVAVPYIETAQGSAEINLPDDLKSSPVCLDMDIATDLDAEVLLNGRAVPKRGAVLVPKQAYTISVIQKNKDGFGIQYEEEISPNQFEYGIKCRPIKRDLRSSRAITLTRLKIEDTCMSSAASPGKLWGEAEMFLKENESLIGMKFRDLRALSEISDDLASLQHVLTSNLDGEPVGAERKSAAVDRLVNDAAQELWRQGIGQVIAVELQCPPASVGNTQRNRRWRNTSPPSTIRYSLLAWKMDIGKFYNSTRDSTEGVNLDDLIALESETVDESPQLERALERIIARLTGIPYLRFIGGRESRRFHERILLTLEHIKGSRHQTEEVHFNAFQFAHDEDDTTCDLLERTGRIAGRVPNPLGLGPKVPQVLRVTENDTGKTEDAVVRSYTVEVKPNQSGTVLVAASLGPENAPIDTVYRCVTIKPTHGTVWAKFNLGTRGVTDVGIEHTPYTSSYVGAQIGWGVYLDSHRSTWMLGSYFGTTAVTRTLNGPLSWDALPSAANEASGAGEPSSYDLNYRYDSSINFEWDRHSIDFGLAVVYEGSICRFLKLSCHPFFRKIEGLFGVDLGMNLGFITPNETVKEFYRFTDEQPKEDAVFDMDIDAAAHIGIGYHATNRFKMNFVFTLLLPAVDDYFQALFAHSNPEKYAEIMRTITFDSTWVPGFSIRMGLDI